MVSTEKTLIVESSGQPTEGLGGNIAKGADTFHVAYNLIIQDIPYMIFKKDAYTLNPPL